MLHKIELSENIYLTMGKHKFVGIRIYEHTHQKLIDIKQKTGVPIYKQIDNSLKQKKEILQENAELVRTLKAITEWSAQELKRKDIKSVIVSFINEALNGK